MLQSDIVIRPIQLSDLGGAMRLSTEQGWNQTEADWRFMIEHPENSCLLAEYHGKIIGTTTAINYSNEVVWISMVLVDKEYRGHGISKLLLNNILGKLSGCKSIKLDATPEGQRVYKQYNFIDEYLITRMTNDAVKNLFTVEDDYYVEPIRLHDLQDIITYDHQVFGAKRTSLIDSLIRTYPNRAWMLKRNHSIIGFALGREGRKYNHIGPVQASTVFDAKTLIAKLLQQPSHKPFVVDVLNDKEDLITWLNEIGFIRQREFIRMYQRDNPFPGNLDQQYLICGPEFG